MINKKYFKKVILLITLISTVLPMLLAAQERVLDGVTITKNTVWRGTIRLKGDVVVKKNVKLIIEGGTKVLFAANTDVTKSGKDKTKSEIIVEGIIDVQGDLNNKVIFTSAADNPRMGDWYGITIINPRVASIIEYAVIEYAYNAISTKRSHPQIRKCQIRYNYNAGLLFEVKSNPKVIENIISENGYAGIICKLGSKPVLTGNLIALNQIGVVIFSMSKPNFGKLNKGQNYNIGMNDIHDNQEYNIYNHSNEQIFAENNSWGSTSLSKIKEKNFDRTQNSKYGSVKVEPLLQTEQNKEKLMALAQQPSVPSGAANAANASPSPSASPSQGGSTDLTKTATGSVIKANSSSPATGGSENTNRQETISRSKIANTPPVIVPIKEKKAVKPAAPAIDFNQVFLEPFLDKKRRKIRHSVVPTMSESMRKLKAKGRVIVRVVVDKNGNVESAQILKGINEFYDQECLNAAKEFKFEQGTVKSVPVRFSTNLFFMFD
jgi:TonB family protein